MKLIPGLLGTHEGIWHSSEDPAEAETMRLWQEKQIQAQMGQLHSCPKRTEHLLLWVPHLRVLDFFLFLLANYRAKLLCMHAKLLSRVQLFAILWTIARQALPSMGFSRQEY